MLIVFNSLWYGKDEPASRVAECFTFKFNDLSFTYVKSIDENGRKHETITWSRFPDWDAIAKHYSYNFKGLTGQLLEEKVFPYAIKRQTEVEPDETEGSCGVFHFDQDFDQWLIAWATVYLFSRDKPGFSLTWNLF